MAYLERDKGQMKIKRERKRKRPGAKSAEEGTRTPIPFGTRS
jgi:hypothetical protein